MEEVISTLDTQKLPWWYYYQFPTQHPTTKQWLPAACDNMGQEIFYPCTDERLIGYEVSMFGKVKSPIGNILNTKSRRDGYTILSITVNGTTKGFAIHRIVAYTFIYNDSPSTKTNVDHINGDRSNNTVWSLRHVTPSENKLNQHDAKSYIPINQYNLTGELMATWESITEAARRTGIGRKRIDTACYNNNGIPIEGYIFRFVTERERNSDNPMMDFSAYSLRPTSRPLVRFEPNTQRIVGIYGSRQAAKKASGINDETIRKCIKENRCDKNNYFWRESTPADIDLYLSIVPPDSEFFGQWRRLRVKSTIILVSSKGYIVSGHGKASRGSLTATNYYSASIMDKQYQVHRLILQAFRPVYDPDFYACVDHIDNMSTNNDVSNLRWATTAENNSFRHDKIICKYSLEGVLLGRYLSISEAGKSIGVIGGGCISRGLNSTTLTDYGYIWKSIQCKPKLKNDDEYDESKEDWDENEDEFYDAKQLEDLYEDLGLTKQPPFSKRGDIINFHPTIQNGNLYIHGPQPSTNLEDSMRDMKLNENTSSVSQVPSMTPSSETKITYPVQQNPLPAPIIINNYGPTITINYNVPVSYIVPNVQYLPFIPFDPNKPIPYIHIPPIQKPL